MKVGIWGYGFVGQAQHYIIDESAAQVTIYDIKEKYKANKSMMLDQDIIFICLPTPPAESGAQNASLVTDALEQLRLGKFRGTVVVKSTVLARHLEYYAEVLNLCYNPEFLNQNTSFEDAMNQQCVILGGEPQATLRVEEFYSKCTHLECPSYELMSIKEASDFKHIRNVYGAYKVLFWEFVQDTTGNSRKMADLFKKISYQSEMSQVGMDGFRGFGGTCFPKDTSAWDKEHNHELTELQ
jgi:UDPglucose 6-dehydrogenase